MRFCLKFNKGSFNIVEASNLFILDLRGSELELHRFSVLVQFFTYLSEVYNEFEVWIDKETFLFGGSRLYSKEANDIMELIQC